MKFFLGIISFFLAIATLALPVDWHGNFGLDTTFINNHKLIDGNDNPYFGIDQDSTKETDTSFQTYLFRLNPTIIINDSATVFAEFSSGYGDRGKNLGVQGNNEGSPLAGALYLHNMSTARPLGLTKMYMKYYSDTATYILGRHDYHWGLGAIYNDGSSLWDRFATIRDGLTLDVKLGNFHITPYWAKTFATDASSATRTREYGTGLLYDNRERELSLGVQFGKKRSTSFENEIEGPSKRRLGGVDIKITDIYFKKSIGDFNIGLEIPLFDGSIGDFYGPPQPAKYKARSFLVESGYKLSPNWNLFLNAGKVSGDTNDQSRFEATYLHPNYQVANLLFRYNLKALSSPYQSAHLFNSYITNASFLKFAGKYQGQKWDFDLAWVWAKAEQTAIQGKSAFNHTTGILDNIYVNQDDSLGMEFDMNITYRWNKEISVGLASGYLLTGDYFAFTNDPNKKVKAKNAFIVQLKTGVNF